MHLKSLKMFRNTLIHIKIIYFTMINATLYLYKSTAKHKIIIYLHVYRVVASYTKPLYFKFVLSDTCMFKRHDT